MHVFIYSEFFLNEVKVELQVGICTIILDVSMSTINLIS